MTTHIHQHEAFSYISHAHEDLQNIEQCQQFTIYELEAIYYESEELTIRRYALRECKLFSVISSSHHHRSYSEDIEDETLAEDVASLYVSNRFARSKTFNGGAPTPFQGYGQSEATLTTRPCMCCLCMQLSCMCAHRQDKSRPLYK